MSVSVPRDLGRLSLLLVLLGVAVLYAASAIYTPPVVSVAAIDGGRMGEMVRVDGVVSSVRDDGENTFFTVSDGDTRVRAVAFRPGLGLEESVRYQVTGRVDVYRGEPELIVHRVSRLE